ncbi:MAG: ribonuclease Z [Clostridia bacterium]|nr:ribonuclease Z [Clostridia bacterium]
MKIILCLDDKGGMMFHHRRQSRDREVIRDIAETIGDGCLFLNGYSASLFSETELEIRVEEEFLDLAQTEDWCFVEDRTLSLWSEQIQEVVLYRWNRVYPSDLRLDWYPEKHGLFLCDIREFAGYSHEKITKEIYRR